MSSPATLFRARCFGDSINSDYIISSSRKRETIDADVLKQYLMEGVDPGFAASVRPNDVIVAGKNFGCGSAMEVAATVILAAGIRAVLAQSFARAFFRNAINNGLMPIEVDTSDIAEDDSLSITAPSFFSARGAPPPLTRASALVPSKLGDPTPEPDSLSSRGAAGASVTVLNLRSGDSLVALDFPPIVRDILASGGLVPYLRREGRFRL